MAKILVIEADESARQKIVNSLGEAGHDVTEAPDVTTGLKRVSERPFEVILIDSAIMKDADLDPIIFMKQAQPSSEIIILTDPNEIGYAIDGIRKGAYLYVPKTAALSDILLVVKNALRKRETSTILKEFKSASFKNMVGGGAAMNRVLVLASKVAPTDSTVLLLGESGTGKDIVANFIHNLSHRHEGPFVAINCAALPETLLESELFGYVKGAFTGAVGDKQGLFQEAHKGTIFLDEIGEMPLSIQTKLLRVLQNGEVRRLGENKLHHVDVRVIASTNKDLVAAMAEKTFREDLYYRLNVIQIKLPPLRERMETVPALIRHFVMQFNAKFRKNITKIDDEAQLILANYHYPGNIRELENIIEHAAIMADDGVIRAHDLPDYISQGRQLLALPPSDPQQPDEFITLKEMETRLITQTLARCNGNQTDAAKKLGISRSTLWRKMQRLGIKE